MLLFIGSLACEVYRIEEVSIHPMLLFIRGYARYLCHMDKCQYIPCYCSSRIWLPPAKRSGGCQYIPCYCSSGSVLVVLVLMRGCQYIPCYCSSTTPFRQSSGSNMCQYIPCYCSSHTEIFLYLIDTCVNTSHVIVHQIN